MKIQVLGTGCPKCHKLAELTERVAREKQLDFTLEKVTDINAILAAGVMMTPALLVDGEIKVSGRIPTEPELQTLLTSTGGK
ncbi:MAG: TM0996/MTH895 family glutaredoxin-like protein [bacterium]|nr:TM0996/MTH895 family glutaredoxin-like protein [bacterium]MBK6911715.1 TM0996/MTH895 family glutaredoxin-like protein [bacterium]MBK8127736.1 TM0996/MTH895 family glutaredoxin-like protein [bacterium]